MAYIADPCPDCGGKMDIVQYGVCGECGGRFDGRRIKRVRLLDRMRWVPYRDWRKEPGDGE
jgi:hypothetical protein